MRFFLSTLIDVRKSGIWLVAWSNSVSFSLPLPLPFPFAEGARAAAAGATDGPVASSAGLSTWIP